MRIWKYQIKVTDRQAVPMPAGAKLLDIQMQNGAPCVWALCDENASIEPRYLAIYGTGGPIPNDPGEYIATFQMQAGDLVFHVFEIEDEDNNDDVIVADKVLTAEIEAQEALERKMEKRNMASFAVAPRLIEEALTMPKGHEIVGAEWDFASRTVWLFVEGPDLPEVNRGQIVPSITPSVTVAAGDDGRRVHTWHWNAANAKIKACGFRIALNALLCIFVNIVNLLIIEDLI